MGLTAFRKVQIGKESTSGTSVVADKRLYGTLTVTPSEEKHTPTDEDGRLSSFRRIATTKEQTKASFSGDLDYETILDWLSMVVKGGVSGAQQAATLAYLWTFTPSLVSSNSQETYTFEYGDENQEFEFDFGFVERIQIDFEMGQIAQVSVDIIGRDLTKSTFTSVSDNSNFEEVVANKLDVWIDPAWASLGTTKKSTLVPRGSIIINSGLSPVWYADGSLEFAAIKENKRSIEVQLDLVMGTDGITEYDAWKADTLRALRLKFTGSKIDPAPYNYYFQLDMLGYYVSEPTLFSDSDGENTISMTLQSHRDTSDNEYEVTVMAKSVTV